MKESIKMAKMGNVGKSKMIKVCIPKLPSSELTTLKIVVHCVYDMPISD
jgi:hypothetical protein